MNVSKITKAQLVELLRASYAENAQLRQTCAEWAHQSKVDRQTILKLKERASTNAPNSVPNFAERCRLYCEQNNVRSVPAHVVREWRAQH